MCVIRKQTDKSYARFLFRVWPAFTAFVTKPHHRCDDLQLESQWIIAGRSEKIPENPWPEFPQNKKPGLKFSGKLKIAISSLIRLFPSAALPETPRGENKFPKASYINICAIIIFHFPEEIFFMRFIGGIYFVLSLGVLSTLEKEKARRMIEKEAKHAVKLIR